ncbi:MAG: bacterial transcriptional activator domain-containing protein [Bacteroidales bacterium]|nr:bacterial transcriptional activator domain-containing protein [Bacteroidales bacterium]
MTYARKARLEVILFLLLLPALRAGAEAGLGFSAYEAEPENRTSLVIPSQECAPFKFKKAFKLSFDFRLKPSHDVFGYVCRIMVADEVVDLLAVNPRGESPKVVVTGGQEMLPVLEGDIREWHTLQIQFRRSGTDSIAVSVNGVERFLPADGRNSASQVRIFFGRNTDSGMFTNDVAPMFIRNVSVTVNDRDSYFWELRDWTDLTRYGKTEISVENPDWSIERSRHWHKTMEFRSTEKIFHAVDLARGRVNLITPAKVVSYDLSSCESVQSGFEQPLAASRLANDFAVMSDGSIAYVDVAEKGVVVNRYDGRAWQGPVNRSSHSLLEHHNSFVNPVDSSFMVMFGYGQHRYFNDLTVISPDGSFRKLKLEEIPPRYLSAVGLGDGCAYILGGKGNPKGIQEYGIVIYNDIWRLDLSDFTTENLGSFGNEAQEVAADRLIVEDDGRTLVGLFYSPNVFKTALQLKSVDLETGTVTPLGEPLPYDFLDVNSDATLLRYGDAYHAVLVTKESNASYLAEMYEIILPVDTGYAHPETSKGKDRLAVLLSVLASVLLAGICAVLLRFRVRSLRRKKGNEFRVMPRAEGVHLLGAFKVMDRAGRDLTPSFTPTMKQLMALLLVTTAEGRGVSNSQMKDALWFDKSEESFFNNRGVNLAKIRKVFAEAGIAMELVSENGIWTVRTSEDLCDFLKATSMMRKMGTGPGDPDFGIILGIASLGPLLPEMRAEWLDKYKENYDGTVADHILRLFDGGRLDNEQTVALADAMLEFDSLDENALREKCNALVSLKRTGTARTAFENFTARYKASMGEEYPLSFSEFLRQASDTQR